MLQKMCEIFAEAIGMKNLYTFEMPTGKKITVLESMTIAGTIQN